MTDVTAAKQWDEMSKTDNFLITTDNLLEDESFIIKSAQHRLINLIHYDLPKWKQFSRRFKVFRNAISEKFQAKEANIATNI